MGDWADFLDAESYDSLADEREHMASLGDPDLMEARGAEEHHAKHCESRGLDRMAPFERCPFRSWHVAEARLEGNP